MSGRLAREAGPIDTLLVLSFACDLAAIACVVAVILGGWNAVAPLLVVAAIAAYGAGRYALVVRRRLRR